MRILFVFGGKQKGGAERVITNLANNMIKEHEVYFLGLREMDSFYKINDKIRYYFLEDEIDYNKNFLIRNFNRTKKIKKNINEINPDIIISFSREQSYRILFTNLFNKRKIIVSVRNDPKQEYKSFCEKKLMKILYSRADGFVFQTEEARNFFPKAFRDKSIIIPNPINEDYIVPLYDGKRKKNIVTAGRLVEQKNHKLLIEAFSKVSDEFKDYNLIIYGKGDLKEDLVDQIKKLNLKNRVILAGEVDSIKEKIYDASLFVLSSIYEGMPNSLIEAMALGLPCISTDCPCGGPRFLINNGVNGILVPLDDSEAMATKIKEMLKNEEKSSKMGKNASKIVNELHPKTINKNWLEYIQIIVKK